MPPLYLNNSVPGTKVFKLRVLVPGPAKGGAQL